MSDPLEICDQAYAALQQESEYEVWRVFRAIASQTLYDNWPSISEELHRLRAVTAAHKELTETLAVIDKMEREQ